jgi:hypothetical protein
MLGIIVLAAGMLSSCATMDDVVRAKMDGTEGMTRMYPVSSTQAFDIARTVFRWEGSDAIEEHPDEGYMLTSSGPSLFTMGTVMGAWIEEVEGEKSLVTVITKRRVATNLVTTLTESTFHRRFAQAVEMLKRGEELPRLRPEFR